jgi:hypothetical protein
VSAASTSSARPFPEKPRLFGRTRSRSSPTAPFAETKEEIGGFYVVDCESRDEAIGLAGEIPRSPGVVVEVLTIAEV